jgi:carbonic anhydrase
VDILPTLMKRNDDFATRRFAPGLRMMPSAKTIVVGCLDPRVDPADILGIAPGEVAIIRNVGGRITPTTLREIAVIGEITRLAGGRLGVGWNLIILQHTDCGITRLHDSPELLAGYFDIDAAALATRHIDDPRQAVATDIAALHNVPGSIPPALRVSGLVYDVCTGRVETVATTSPHERTASTTN